MVKLSKAIIKKYGISKKAWAVARKKSKSSKRVATTRTRIKSKKRKMVRRKRKSTRRRSAKSMKFVAPMLYGAARQYLSSYLVPLTSKIPLGAISDEVGIYAASWAAKKYLFKGKSVLRDALSVGQKIELARIGESVVNGQVNLGGIFSGISSSAGSSNGYVFN